MLDLPHDCFTQHISHEEMPVTIEPTEQVGAQLLFENDRVRIWDLALAPGGSLEKHIHRRDYCFLVASGGLIRFADSDNPADYQMCSSPMMTWCGFRSARRARSTIA